VSTLVHFFDSREIEMTEESYKKKHLHSLKKERDCMIGQIKLDQKIYEQNIQKLKDLKEIISKLEEIKND